MQKDTTATLEIIPKYTLETERQRQKQRSFARIFTARAQNFAKSGTSVAMNRNKNFFCIVEAAIIAAIISKSQTKNILGGFIIINSNKITKDLIEAVQWIYGFNKKEAIEYIKTCNSEMIENIYFCYLNNLNKAFYND